MCQTQILWLGNYYQVNEICLNEKHTFSTFIILNKLVNFWHVHQTFLNIILYVLWRFATNVNFNGPNKFKIYNFIRNWNRQVHNLLVCVNYNLFVCPSWYFQPTYRMSLRTLNWFLSKKRWLYMWQRNIFLMHQWK